MSPFRARRIVGALVLTAAGLSGAALAATPASAATGVQVFANPANGLVRVIAGSEANGLDISSVGSTVTVSASAGPTPKAGNGCVQLGGAVRCTGAGLISVSLGAGDDAVRYSGDLQTTMEGQGGNDRLSGGSGRDTLNGDNRFRVPGSTPVGGNDNLFGGGGDDRLFGGVGTDTAAGDGGTDSCDAESESSCEVE